MGTYTTNYQLYMPTVGETGWGTLVNGNFTTIDTTMKSLSNRITAVENEVNGALSCTSVTTSGKITGNGGIAGTTGTFSGAITGATIPTLGLYIGDNNITSKPRIGRVNGSNNGVSILPYNSVAGKTETFKGYCSYNGMPITSYLGYQDGGNLILKSWGYTSIKIVTSKNTTINVPNDGQITITTTQLNEILSGVCTFTLTSTQDYDGGRLMIKSVSSATNRYVSFYLNMS